MSYDLTCIKWTIPSHQLEHATSLFNRLVGNGSWYVDHYSTQSGTGEFCDVLCWMTEEELKAVDAIFAREGFDVKERRGDCHGSGVQGEEPENQEGKA